MSRSESTSIHTEAIHTGSCRKIGAVRNSRRFVFAPLVHIVVKEEHSRQMSVNSFTLFLDMLTQPVQKLNVEGPHLLAIFLLYSNH